MRIWEVDDGKALSSSLVREQDFILRIRRLHRLGEPYHVVNVILSASGSSGGEREPLEIVQERLQKLAAATQATYAEMSNGDVFLIFAKGANPKGVADLVKQASCENIKEYRLPADYSALRERTFHYVEVSREAAASLVSETTPAQLLQTDAARGPLTAWSVDQIEKLLRDIDLRRYVKKQQGYEHDDDGNWRVMFEEWFVSFDELRKAHFPKMEFSPADYLFRELCQSLDRRLLNNLLQNLDLFSRRNISVNISIPSVFGSEFAAFARLLPRPCRSHIFCEINAADMFQDFSVTINALGSLRREGFRIMIDGVTPDMLPFINFGLFESDFIKVNVSQERYAQVNDPAASEALKAIPREKLVFYRCDHEDAIVLGLSMGVTKYQGWYLDKAAQSA